jgi:site-specific DNA recombinase
MIVGYARVSRKEQADTDSLEQQIQRIKRAGSVEVFADVESGRKDSRPEFNKLLAECEKGLISEIILTRVDRLGRSVITLHKTIKRLEELKIKLNILDSPVSGDTASGWMMLSQFSVLAEFESRMLQERINHGLDYFREQKKANHPPFGYIRVDERYELDPKTYKIALELIDKFMSSSLRGTTHWLLQKYNLKMTPCGLRYWLLCPVLVGDTGYKYLRTEKKFQQIIPNTHKPIMTRQQQQLIRDRLQANKSSYAFSPRQSKANYPLARLIHCGECGYMCRKCHKPNRDFMRCRKHDQMGDGVCTNSLGVDYEAIKEQVILMLVNRASEIAKYTCDNQPQEIEETPEMLALRQQLRSLEQLPKSEIIDSAIAGTRRLLNSEILKQQQQPKGIPTSLALAFCDEKYWHQLSADDLKVVFEQFVCRVTINKGNITSIELVF